MDISHLASGGKSDFAALPMNFEELKVSFASQKIPLPMKRHDIPVRRERGIGPFDRIEISD
jgi:hypothetical protein